jgi:hypothetical protein
MRDFVLSVDLTVDATLGKDTREKEIGRGTEKLNGRIPKLVKGSVC